MSSSSPLRRAFLKTQFALRALASGFSLAALIVMVTSKQSVSFFGVVFDARYSYSSAFKFLVGVDAVVCGSSLMSLIYVLLLSRSKPHPNTYFTIFLHDLAMSVLMMAGCAAGTAISYVGRYGQSKSGWMAICDQVGKFCHKITVSIVFSYTAFFCCLLLTISAVHKLKSFSALASEIGSQQAEGGDAK